MKSFTIIAIFVAMLNPAPPPAQSTANPGLRVRGHVSGIPVDAPDGLLTVELAAPGVSYRVPIHSDGTFEFKSVPSGRAGVMVTLPRTNIVQLNLDNKDIDGVELSVASPQVLGQFVLENGRPLPTSPDLHAPILKLEARKQKGGSVSYQFVRSDGLFALLSTPPDDYVIRVTLVPAGYSVKSIMYGGVDGLREPLKLTTLPYSFLRITLTKHAAPAGSGNSPSVAQVLPDTGDSTLIVSQSGRGPLYTEGSLSYFNVRSIGSDAFKQEKRLGGEFCITPIGRCDPAGASTGDSLGFSLPAGTYELRGYVRPCDANCGRLDGSADECRTTFRIQSGETLYADRIQNQHACSITVSSSHNGQP